MERWIWQAAFGIIVAALLYWDRLFAWIRAAKRDSAVSLGYLFVISYAFLAVLVVNITFTVRPLPRFDDLFLVGIALAAYFFSAKPAGLLMAIGVAVSTWILPPTGSFRVASATDVYRIFSFSAVSLLLIGAITLLRMGPVRKSVFRLGYLFATAYAALAALIAVLTYHSQPMPRFMDMFLVGIAATAYFFAVAPAAYLWLLSVFISAWVLPPMGSFAVADPEDYYRLISFSVVSALLILITSRLKKGVIKAAAL
jgi:uncharacterized protein DUF4118